MKTLLNTRTEVTGSALAAIAHMPTTSLPMLMEDAFARRLAVADFIRMAVLLAQKSHDEGGWPIGAVIADNATQRVVGKGHNTRIPENHIYHYGKISALRDTVRIACGRNTLDLTACQQNPAAHPRHHADGGRRHQRLEVRVPAAPPGRVGRDPGRTSRHLALCPLACRTPHDGARGPTTVKNPPDALAQAGDYL